MGGNAHMKKIGVLTGGGDCPGLNAAIRAVVRRANNFGYTVLGIKKGWRGMLELEATELLLESVSGILHKGGTILGSSRTNPYKSKKDTEMVKRNFANLGLDALVAIGGEDTLGVAAKLAEDGAPVVGVPKTIDYDLCGTEATIGFDTAVNIATEAIDRLHSTAESHDRVMVVEVMGRHAGWLAIRSGLAGGADLILIPEVPVKMSDIVMSIVKRHNRGKNFSICVVSEGAKVEFDDTGTGKEVVKTNEKDEFGHVMLGGIGLVLADRLRKATGFDARMTALGHVQRGGTPSAYDRYLATHLGIVAVDLIKQGKFGRMAAVVDGKIADTELKNVLGQVRLVPKREYEVAEVFFG